MSAARITAADVRRAADIVSAYCRDAGLTGPGWGTVLQEGSRANGRAWRLYTTRIPDSALHGHPIFGGFGYLGDTRAEAYRALMVAADTLAAVMGDRVRQVTP